MKVLLVAALTLTFPHATFAQPSDEIVSLAAAAPSPAYKSVSKESNKKIGMVISTLKDIFQSVANEEKEETAMFDKYMQWCKSEMGTLSKELSESRTELANSKVLDEEQLASIDTLSLTVSKNEKEIEETKDAIAQAVALRADENGKYTEDVQLNTQSLRQIETAIKHIRGVQQQGGFLQNGVLKKLQLNQPGESSYVLGIMKGLKDKLEKTRKSLMSTEQEKVKMHNSFMETKGKSLKAVTDSTTEKKIALSETTAKEAGTKRKIAKLTESVSSLQGAVTKTTELESTTKQEWSARQADRTKEKATLSEGIRYLTETSLEQVSAVPERSEDTNDEEHAPVVFAPSLLQTVSDSNAAAGAEAFYAAAGAALMGEDEEVDKHMRKDSFNGVKSVVTKLIATHQDAQKEEQHKKQYCEQEIASKDDEKATTTDDLNAIKADIEKKTAEVTQLTDEVKSLYTSIDDIKKSLEEAGKIRKEEASLFLASSKDRSLAIKVLSQAKSVLQEFYDKSKGSFLQQASPAIEGFRSHAPPPGKNFGSRKSSAGFGAISMVQDIADDIAKEQQDATMEENEKAAEYTALQKESATKTDDTQQDITERVVAKAKIGVSINTLKETQTQKADDLNAINKQLESLHKSCDELLEFYDKRSKARDFEVSQLRDVFDVLSGSSMSVRTGDAALIEGGIEEDGDAEQ